MGKHKKTQQSPDLVPSCAIIEWVGLFVLSFAAVSVVSFGPAWSVVPVVIAALVVIG